MSKASLRVLDATQADMAREWLSLWETWPQRDPYAHPAFVRLYADKKTRSLCAVWKNEKGAVLYPFLLRDLTAEPFWKPEVGPVADITTPYGYGGPYFWGEERDQAPEFWKQFDLWAAENKVVSEYIRFHLLMEEILSYPGEMKERVQHVIRDLAPTAEELWAGYGHKVRKNVKTAMRQGVVVEFDPAGKRLDEFYGVYKSSMERRNARVFPLSYFEKINCELRGQFMYSHAERQGKVISTELVLISEDSVYSFLGGTDHEAFELRPNDLLKHEIILWAKKLGKRRFVLGGGNVADDGIFRYKREFAPKGCVPHFIGLRVLQADLYEKLLESRADWARSEGKTWSPNPDFFPAYRS